MLIKNSYIYTGMLVTEYKKDRNMWPTWMIIQHFAAISPYFDQSECRISFTATEAEDRKYGNLSIDGRLASLHGVKLQSLTHS